jgi:hypothetical protein
MFGYIDKEQNCFTFDTLEKARTMKAQSGDCSTIQFRTTLEKLLVILKG